MRHSGKASRPRQPRVIRISLATLLLGATSLPPGARAASEPMLQPFAPPAAFSVVEPATTPFVDVTGTIPSLRAQDPAGDAALAPVAGVPELGIVPPDLPQPAMVESRPVPPLSVNLETVLANWKRASTSLPGPDATENSRRRQAVREAIAEFYQSRQNTPVWIEGEHFSAAARAALSRIDRAGEDGLTLRAYPVPVLRDAAPAQLAEAELALSEAVVAYAQQAGGARIDPLQINRLITAKRTIAEVPAILPAVAGAADAGVALQAFNPPQPGYAALRQKLAEMRQAAPMARTGIPTGPTLKLGMRDPRVPLIRSRFGLDARPVEAADDLVYDTKVAGAVAEFQRANGLPASGALTPRTITMLSGGDPTRLENELLANMERWRWVPRDLGADHLTVNVPDYSLDLVHDGAVIHHARVVVGKPDHQTPIFSDAMRFLIVNPYWNVPLSIIKKEMLPKLAENPNYFADHGYEVVQRDGTTFVRQPPGEDNALGRIKFMFPNQHSVYLHDTNARALFGKTVRAFSHGCVRVDQPFKLAEALLGADRGLTAKRIENMVGGSERTINLPAPVPIHIVYFTAYVDDRGSLQLRDDLYGYSQKVRLALGLRE